MKNTKDTIRTLEAGTPEWDLLFRKPGSDDLRNTLDLLHVRGDLSAILDKDRPRILITGSRDITSDVPARINCIVSRLSVLPSRPVIITGLAVGTDKAAIDAALYCGLPVVAVLPSPIESIYPRMYDGLAERLANNEGCALLSEFTEGTTPVVTCFLNRNRTMALLSDLMVLVSAKEKGGATITARHMYDLDKPVVAVPGRPDDERSKGCNLLISQHIAEIYIEDQLGTCVEHLIKRT